MVVFSSLELDSMQMLAPTPWLKTNAMNYVLQSKS